MKRKYESYNMTQRLLDQLKVINKVVENYRQQGYRLTLRQLYYQLVARGIVPNKDTEYKKLSDLLRKGRMAGLVDWDSIEDRTRVPKLDYAVDDIDDAIDDTISQYKLKRLDDQSVYIEVWCEKDAISNILRRMTNKYHVRLMINKGYSSASAMYKSAQRFRRNGTGKKKILMYFGDHDPSGLDMIRDIGERLRTFGVKLDTPDGYPTHLGITMEQVEEYQPPENPAKITDPRAEWYIEEHGESSWEVDALEPSVLNELIETEILRYIDEDKYNVQIRKEISDKKKLEKLKELAEDLDIDETCEQCGNDINPDDDESVYDDDNDSWFCNQECKDAYNAD